MKGPSPDWIWLVSEKREKERSIDSMRYRELVRIRTAGGKLSANASRRLTFISARLDNPPAQVAVVDGLRHVSWSGWGHAGDLGLVADTAPEELLEKVTAIEKADPINQDGLWVNLCRERPDDAIAALVATAARGAWPPARWRDFLSASLMAFKDGIDEHQVTSVVQAIGGMRDEDLIALLPTACSWLMSLSGAEKVVDLRDAILKAWDRLANSLTAWAETTPADDPGKLNLLERSINHPAGHLSSVLITLQDHSPKEASGGLANDLVPRFEQLLGLPAQLRLMALAPVVRVTGLFLWLAPEWTEQNVFETLDSDDADAHQLLSALVLYGHYQDIRIFNRLKRVMESSLNDPQLSEDARNRIAQFITWAIMRRIDGDGTVDLTEPEARRLLTLAPTSALRSVAWSLWRSLDEPQDDEGRDIWLDYVQPFLTRVWPNDVIARDPQVSDMLIKLPAVAGPHLPEAVDLVRRLIVPVQMNTVYFDLDLHEKSNIIQQFPREVFSLASIALQLGEVPPHDLANFLEEIGTSAPDLRDDPRFISLRNTLQNF